MAHWYAVYTRPRWEKKVAETLQKKKLEHYCPQSRVLTPWNSYDRRRAVYQPVFPSYVFVRTTEDALHSLKKISGVINIIYWRDRPAVIRDIEIEMMRRFLQEHETVTLEKTTVNTSEIVKVINSSLSHDDRYALTDKVKLVLPSLGFVLEAIVEKEVQLSMPETRPLGTSLAKFG